MVQSAEAERIEIQARLDAAMDALKRIQAAHPHTFNKPGCWACEVLGAGVPAQ